MSVYILAPLVGSFLAGLSHRLINNSNRPPLLNKKKGDEDAEDTTDIQRKTTIKS